MGPFESSGAVVGEDLGPPESRSVAERSDLGRLVLETPDDRLVEEDRGFIGVVGQVNDYHRLLRQPRTEELVVRVADP